ncbi:hypothetical protein CLUG_05480 [Clavispora lusitaniae ATCC 42720]|uniref:Uncharacterized protein n=1 Tax=Clavispora lusitaniae (strain ATCC 42720) TaxID=306902 RepID=C4YBA2_CLAL4|nr:uncharacterized protein CLUG_05480 [Clavispora lusitaniae ATCC 42720]EEQ41352.1 hypothetical protein CLUG_05480 [Clavispora lusitaniae ATCC 42720]
MPKRKDHRQLHGPQHGRRGENGAAVYYLHARPPLALACSFVLGRFSERHLQLHLLPCAPSDFARVPRDTGDGQSLLGGVPSSPGHCAHVHVELCRFFRPPPDHRRSFSRVHWRSRRPLASAGVSGVPFAPVRPGGRHSAGDRHQRRHFGRRVHARRPRRLCGHRHRNPFGRTSVRVAFGLGHPQPSVVARHLRLSCHRPGRHARASSLSAHRNVPRHRGQRVRVAGLFAPGARALPPLLPPPHEPRHTYKDGAPPGRARGAVSCVLVLPAVGGACDRGRAVFRSDHVAHDASDGARNPLRLLQAPHGAHVSSARLVSLGGVVWHGPGAQCLLQVPQAAGGRRRLRPGPCPARSLGVAACVFCGGAFAFRSGVAERPQRGVCGGRNVFLVARQRSYHRHCHHDDGGFAPGKRVCGHQRGQLGPVFHGRCWRGGFGLHGAAHGRRRMLLVYGGASCGFGDAFGVCGLPAQPGGTSQR